MENIFNFLKNLTLIDIVNFSTAFLIALIFNIFAIVLSKLVIRIINKNSKLKENIKDNYLFKPLIWYLKLIGIYLGIMYLKPEGQALLITNKLLKICTIIFVCKVIASYLNNSNGILKRISSKLNKDAKASVLVIKVLVFAVYFVGVSLIISELGYNITSIVAGLGIGGVIIALAAQDTAKNLFGGAMIILDKPFSIGDWVQTSNVEGIVEDITFRSTRIRMFRDSLITIPNSTITNDSIINWSRMKKRRTNVNLELVFDTSIKKVYNFTKDVEKMLAEDENVLNENIAVAFSEINSNGYNIMISYFTNITNYYAYLKIKENINYKIMQILESKKISLAYNSYDLYIKK